jgi:CubicO group peptidase (beta-lactamase class C family)
MNNRDSVFRALADQIQDAMRRYCVPGVAVGVLLQDEEFTAGFGVTSVENPLAVDADTLFQIGSTTKTFTATLIMRLVEMQKLDLDAPVRKYLPAFQLDDENVAAHVTLRHLLTHRGGWLGDYFDDTGDGDDAIARYVNKMVELPQLTPLGSVYHYNNAGFAVAGRVIELATAKTYEKALREMVLEPLGLNMSFFFPRHVMTRRFVVGHNVEEDQPKVARPWPIARSANPVGGISSTVNDQLRYARFCLSDGAPLLSRDSMRLMQTPQASAALDEQIGLSWFISDASGTRTIRHGGATNGQQSAFLFVPERRFAVTVLTNSNRGAELHREMTKAALEKFLDVREPEHPPIPMIAAQLQTFVGKYTSALADADLYLRDGELILQSLPKGGFPAKDSPPPPTPPPSRLAFSKPDRVIAQDGWFKDMEGEFLRDENGKIVWFRFGGRVRAREVLQ